MSLPSAMRSIVAIAVTASLFSTQAHACTCVKQSKEGQFQSADVIFSGWLLGSHDERHEFEWLRRVETRFLVVRTYKGSLPNEIDIQHNKSESMCGLSYSGTTRLVVFASQTENGQLVTSSCQALDFNGRPENEVRDELEALQRKYKAPITLQEITFEH